MKVGVGDRVALNWRRDRDAVWGQKFGDQGTVIGLRGAAVSVRWDNGSEDPVWDLEWLTYIGPPVDPTDYAEYYEAITESRT